MFANARFRFYGFHFWRAGDPYLTGALLRVASRFFRPLVSIP